MVLVVLGIAFLAYQAGRTAWALHEAEVSAGQLQSRLSAGDEAAARAAASRLADQARVARSSSDGWGFAALTHLPFLGDDVDAVRRVARSVDVLGSDALPPALDVVETVRGDGSVPPTVGSASPPSTRSTPR